MKNFKEKVIDVSKKAFETSKDFIKTKSPYILLGLLCAGIYDIESKRLNNMASLIRSYNDYKRNNY